MWAIIHFTADNSVEPVPTYWLNTNNTKCAWPNNDSLIQKYRSNRTKPNTFDFSFYDCRVLSTNITSFSEAQKKAELGLYTSDLEDIDKHSISINKPKNPVSQKRKTNYFKPSVSFTESSKTSVKRFNTSNKTQNINNKKKKESVEKKLSSSIPINFELDDDGCPSDVSSIDDTDLDLDYTPVDTESFQIDNDGNNLVLGGDKFEDISCGPSGNIIEPNTKIQADEIDFITSSKKLKPTNNFGLEKIDTPNSDFQKIIINYLAFLKVEVCKLSDKQQELIELYHNSKSDKPQTDELNFEVDYFISNWPISDITGITYMEDKMKTDNSFQKLIVSELARTGGKSLPNMIYKMMKKVFTDKILTEYTYYGLRNKNKFSALSINKALFDAVKMSKFKNCCDDEVIASIGKWLTTAKARLENKAPPK